MTNRTPASSRTATSQFRLRVGFVILAIVMSALAARLIQLQGLDNAELVARAASEGTTTVELPAKRGEILDRSGEPLAASIEGRRIIADPRTTAPDAPRIAKVLTRNLGVDYAATVQSLREKTSSGEYSRYEYIARRVPSTKAQELLSRLERLEIDGIWDERDPVREYPGGEVAANIIGFMGIDEPLAGMERTFDDRLAGVDGEQTYAATASKTGPPIPLGENTLVKPVDGQDLRLTIDRDIQWHTQKVLEQTVRKSGGSSGYAIVQDTRTGDVLSLADYPSYNANKPAESKKEDRGSRAMSNVYEPGSVQKALTAGALVDAGKVTPTTKISVPGQLARQGRVIHDYFEHGRLNLTFTGVLAKSSNIGTVLATDKISTKRLDSYLRAFGLGERTHVGIRNESPGILAPASQWSPLNKDRIAFGQSVSVNALQMTAALNTIANDGEYISPSIIQGEAVTDKGVEVGTETAERRQVISSEAAEQVRQMLERVVDPEAGVAPAARVNGYRVAGKTGTAQRVGAECGCYDGTYTVSFGGFAPADDPRFTVYVVVQDPKNGGGGGSVAGPAFSQIMGHVLRQFGVPPTNSKPPRLPVTW